MSEKEIREGAWFERLWLRLKPPLRAPVALPVGVRELPRFLTVSDFTEGQSVSIIIPTARRTWWIVAVLGLLAFWAIALPLLVPFSMAGGFYDRGSNAYVDPYFNPLLFAFYLLPLLGVTWLVWWAAFPRIRITADQKEIRVHGRRYGWDRAKGFRLGYSLGGVERKDSQGFYAGLRMAYGPWGDDLPFMVRDYYAPAYIMFLNQALQSVQPRAVDIPTDSVVDRIVF
jgi:hypothetical protein